MIIVVWKREKECEEDKAIRPMRRTFASRRDLLCLRLLLRALRPPPLTRLGVCGRLPSGARHDQHVS